MVGLQRYNGQLNKTVTSYENQMREYQVTDAGNIVAGIIPKLEKFMDRRGPSPEIVKMLGSLAKAVTDSREGIPLAVETAVKGAVGGAIANIVDAVVKIERDFNDLNARELEKDCVKQQLEADSGIAEFDSFFTSTPAGVPPPKGPNFSFPPPPVKSSEVEGAPGGREAPGPKRQLYADSPADRRVFAAQHQASLVLGMQDGVVQGGCLNGSVQQVAGQGTGLQYGAGQQFGGQYGAGQQFAGQYGVGQQFGGQYGAVQLGGGQQFGGQCV